MNTGKSFFLLTAGRSIAAFLRVPSNAISILAVLGAFGAPAVDKWLKSDELLNAQISTLVTTTDELIQVNDVTLVPPTPAMRADPTVAARMQVSIARREILLNRATALAKAIGDHAYPPILFALSSQLCRDGRYSDANGFLGGILSREQSWSSKRRPGTGDLAQAHIVSARCLVLFGMGGAPLQPLQRTEIKAHMTRALELYDKDGEVQAASEKANVLSEWAEMDRRIGSPKDAESHDKEAQALFAQVEAKIPASSFLPPTTPAPAPAVVARLEETDLPTIADGVTYKVLLEGRPDFVGRLMVNSAKGSPDWQRGAVLFRYEGDKFVQESTAENFDRVGSGMVLRWRPSIPGSFDGKPSRMMTEWVVAALSADHLEGIQQTANSAPIRFTAVREMPSRAMQ